MDIRRCSFYECNLHGSREYACEDEYNFVGPSVITCVGPNTWAPLPPGRCVHKGEVEFAFQDCFI